MKRLVYAPKVEAYVKTDFGVIDVSPYITSGSVQRKLDQVSNAQITLRNPNKKWTDYRHQDSATKDQVVGPVFHPMDPIVILMTRLRDRPIQVFTGYLDSSPYLQLFPGTVTLQASCTLKRLQYTYFDPGLPFFEEFLSKHGWQISQERGIVNPGAEEGTASEKGQLEDSGFGQILFSVLKEIGGWNDSTIYIEKLPTGLIELVTKLFDESVSESKESNKAILDLMHKIIGTATLGSGGFTIPVSGGGAISPTEGTVTGHAHLTAAKARFCSLLAGLTGLSLKVIGAWVAYENGPDDNPLNIGPGYHYGTVEAGANATNKLLRSSLYKGIMATVGKPDRDQCEAIAASPWCPGCPGYLETLLSILNDIKVTQ